MATFQTQRQQYVERLNSLKAQRSSWDARWRELGDYILPGRNRFNRTDRNQGTRKDQNIINNTATKSARVLAAGMMSGLTSPARPWFQLSTPHSDLNELGSVKTWCGIVESRVRQALAKSNFYKALPEVYLGLGVNGTAPYFIDEDSESILRCYVLPLGQYSLANDARLRVDTCYREFSMTVAQLVQKFGLENCSDRVKHLHETNKKDEWVDVLHAVEPNDEHQPGKLGPLGKKWKSCFLEVAAPDDENVFLREEGYFEFPVMAPRWNVTGEDVYGTSPGMDAIGDVKSLQLKERRKAQVVDKIVQPPMQGPTSLQMLPVDLKPGGMTYVDAIHPGQSFRPAMEIHPSAMAIISSECREDEARVKATFFADLWLSMLNGENDPQRTAREIAERHEEKMLQLGPVLFQLEDDMLAPSIGRVFSVLLRRGDLPPPPEELQGVELKIDYIGILPAAQKLVSAGGVERLVNFAVSVATGTQKAEVLDKVDFDQCIDEYAEALGVSPSLVVPDERVAKIRDARAQAQQKQAQMEQQMAVTQGAKTLSETDTSGQNALTDLIGNGMPAAMAGVSR